MSAKGVKVPMGEHTAHIHADMTMWSLTCSCGWQKSARSPAYVDERLMRQEALDVHAQHVRHMALVHDAQTHRTDNCGHSCIYPRAKVGVSDE